MEIPNYEPELYHHGIKGMKWGVRRYQTKDGSLTPKGLNRYRKDMAKIQKEEHRLANERVTAAKITKLENARKRVDEQKAELNKKHTDNTVKKSKEKLLSEMSDAEVAAYRQRIQNERDIIKLQNEMTSMTPKEVGKVERFMDKYGSTIVKTVWNDVGKNQINKFLEKNLSVEKPLDELGKLKKEADIWKQKESISKSKNTIWNNDKNQKEYSESKDRKNKEKSEKERRVKEAATKEAQKKVDDYNKTWWKNDSVRPEKDPNKVDKNNRTDWINKPLIGDDIERFYTTGKNVVGEGTSKYKPKKGPIVDAYFYETPMSELPDIYERRGRKITALISGR